MKDMATNKFKVGDKVIIDDPKSTRHRLKGEVRSLFLNGAMIKLGENRFTPVQFTHLKKYENK